jgi:hypothetical protein
LTKDFVRPIDARTPPRCMKGTINACLTNPVLQPETHDKQTEVSPTAPSTTIKLRKYSQNEWRDAARARPKYKNNKFEGDDNKSIVAE